MESTKGKMNMHFETIAKDQTGNADRRMPTVNAHCITNIPTANAMQADGASAQLRELGLNDPENEKELEEDASKKQRNQAVLGLTARDSVSIFSPTH